MNLNATNCRAPDWSTVRSLVQIMAAAAGVLLLLTNSMFAQGSAGRILGNITDQTGGAMAGATVTITDVQRGITKTLTTDEAGAYSAPNLIPGTYTVRAEAKGFKTAERSGFTLEVNQDLRVDLSMQPGEQNQTITVTGELPQIETTNATLGGTLQNVVINQLPLNGRNFENLLTLRPGVTIYSGGGGWTQSTNGIRAHDNTYMVDGVNSNDPWMAQSIMNAGMSAGDAGTILPIDAIDEFKTEVNPEAEYGWKPGAVVNVGIRSGTNTMHGTAYAYGRDGAWDALDYFSTAGLNGGTPVTTPLTLEQFGATLGGPIKKDKLFYFLTFEDQRYSVGSPAQARVPITSGGNAGVQTGQYDPAIGLVGACLAAGSGATALSEQMAGLLAGCVPNTGQNANYPIYPGLFPVNNGTSTTINPNLTNNNRIDSGLVKIDYHLNDKHSFSGSYFISPGNGILSDAPGSDVNPRWLTNQYARAQVTSGAWTWTPDSSWVNEVRVGYSHYFQVFQSVDYQDNPADYSFDGSTFHIYTGQTQPQYFGLPRIRFKGDLGFQMGKQWPKTVGPDGVLNLLDHISYLHGKHTFMFGAEILNNQSTNDVTAYTKSEIDFNSIDGTTPTLQYFFQGQPQVADFATGNFTRHMSFSGYAAFLQDDFRVTPRVTLNLGIRYELNTVFKERDSLIGNFVPGTTAGLEQVGSGITAPYNGDHNNFAPRLGFAWDMFGDGKTVLRGGGGLFYEQLSLDVFNNIANVLGLRTVPTGALLFSNGQPVANSGDIANLVTTPTASTTANWGSNSSTNPLFNPVAACGDGTPVPDQYLPYINGQPQAPGPCTILSVNPDLRTPYVETWNLGVQRAISTSLSLEVAYVGNHGTKLIGMTDLNQPLSGQTITPYTAACAPPIGTNAGGHCYSYLGYVNQAGNMDSSNYNGLQATLTQRPWHGLSYTAGYTYAHALDFNSDNWSINYVPVDSYASRKEQLYGNSVFDIRHRVTFSATYNLPGKKELGQILEGWQLNSITTFQTGTPWGPMDCTDDFLGNGEINNPVGSECYEWNISGASSAFNPIHGWSETNGGAGGFPYYSASDTSGNFAKCLTAESALYSGANLASATTNLNTLGCYVVGNSVIVPPANGTNGNMTRNMLAGPHFFNLDLSVSKNFVYKERLTAQFRAEVFNILNHVNFTNPFGGPGGGANPWNDPSSGPGFGFNSSGTPDVAGGNPVLGAGGPRAIQLGLKLSW